jgi:hypothetical protein
MHRVDAYEMVRRRTAEAGFKGKFGCHVFRAIGVTAYLEAGGTLENAQAMAPHESPRTNQPYDRRGDEIRRGRADRDLAGSLALSVYVKSGGGGFSPRPRELASVCSRGSGGDTLRQTEIGPSLPARFWCGRAKA